MVSQSVHWSELRLVLAFQKDSTGMVYPRIVKAAARSGMSDHDEDYLSIREVNEVLSANGLDPVKVREFAWQLVQQELDAGLPDSHAKRVKEVGIRVRKLVAKLVDAGIQPDILATVLDGVISDLISKTHSDRLSAYLENETKKRSV